VARWHAEIQLSDDFHDIVAVTFDMPDTTTAEIAWADALTEARRIRDTRHPDGVVTYLEGDHRGGTLTSRRGYTYGDLTSSPPCA